VKTHQASVKKPAPRPRRAPRGTDAPGAEPEGQARAGAGRPKDLEKRAAILEAGKRLFPTKGFDGTSMDAVAAEAGVSKLTVYSHFQDKETLFQQVLKAKCCEQLPHAAFELDPRLPLRRQLLEIGRRFVALILSKEALAVHRMITAQPSAKMAQLFWEAGPQVLTGELTQFFDSEVAAGQLEIDDTRRAASQFYCLLKGEPHARLSFGCGSMPAPKELEHHVQATVDTFLRAYAPR
jgi:TetR/AcrR family transcriptional repressor of mexJK operon